MGAGEHPSGRSAPPLSPERVLTTQEDDHLLRDLTIEQLGEILPTLFDSIGPDVVADGNSKMLRKDRRIKRSVPNRAGIIGPGKDFSSFNRVQERYNRRRSRRNAESEHEHRVCRLTDHLPPSLGKVILHSEPVEDALNSSLVVCICRPYGGGDPLKQRLARQAARLPRRSG